MTTNLEAELVLDQRCELGEGPIWDAAAAELVWVDIVGRSILRYRPADGAVSTLSTPSDVGSVAVRAGGGYVAALADGFWTVGPGSDDWTRLAPVDADRPDRRFNDGKCDPAGRFLAGTMGYEKRPGMGALYRLDPDGTVERLLDDVTISNGLAWSEDGLTFYYIDTPTRRVDASDYDPVTGRLAGRRPWIVLPDDEPGSPDGMTIDTDGGLWVALWGGWAVHRYDRAGRLDTIVGLPVSHVTSCTFGGATLEDLYITSAWSERTDEQRAAEPHAGSVFRVRPGFRGYPPVEFAG
jgi:sugar lactone lactonase YvrE